MELNFLAICLLIYIVRSMRLCFVDICSDDESASNIAERAQKTRRSSAEETRAKKSAPFSSRDLKRDTPALVGETP